MKYITVPKPIKAELTKPCPACHQQFAEHREADVTFYQWLSRLLDDPKLWKNPADTRASIKVGNIVTEAACTEGAVLALEDSDYSRVDKVYQDPSFMYHPEVAKASERFMDAWENASSEDPRAKENPETEQVDDDLVEPATD